MRGARDRVSVKRTVLFLLRVRCTARKVEKKLAMVVLDVLFSRREAFCYYFCCFCFVVFLFCFVLFVFFLFLFCILFIFMFD